MASMVNQAVVARIRGVADLSRTGEGVRFMLRCMLDELPGLVFGLVTLTYIFTAFGGLAL
jgi:hypothetical protein